MPTNGVYNNKKEKFMPLSLDETVVTQPVESKEYPFVWIYNLIIHAPSPTGSARLLIEYYPMAADGDLYVAGGIRKIETSNFFECAQQVPEVAAAYTAVLASIAPAKTWIERPAEEGV